MQTPKQKKINYGKMPLNEDTGTYIQDDYVKDDGTYFLPVGSYSGFKLPRLSLAKTNSAGLLAKLYGAV